MTTYTTPEYDFGYTDLEGVVARVNKGAVQGFEHLTSEYLAAAYAVDAAEGYPDSIEFHLGFLSESGAVFNHSEALRICRA